MELIIRNNSGQPIYDQISGQIKAQILSGALSPGQSLHLLEDHLAAAAELARTCGLSESELAELLRRKWEESL
mgnify:CR=1 FL=1